MAAAAAAGCSSGTGSDAGSDAGTVAGSPGTLCDSGFDCGTGSCLGGRCCGAKCTLDLLHPECTACDDTGACDYPGVACGTAVCDPSSAQVTPAGTCQGGSCQPAGTSQACAPYGCNGNACASVCHFDSDCALGNTCDFNAPGASPDAGVCAGKAAGGASCNYADDCNSGTCLHNVCCASGCALDPAHLECTTCDSQGACQYPTDVACRAGGCTADNAFAAPAQCAGLAAIGDGGGACPGTVDLACGEYACGPAGCPTECFTGSDCIPGAVCLPIASVGLCCPIPQPGQPFYVDILVGSDTGCCGLTRDHPCQTIANTLSLVNFINGSGALTPLTEFTLELAVDGGGGDWQSSPPSVGAVDNDVTLADGLTLHGPGVFLDRVELPKNQYLFPKLRATLEGDPGRPLYLGIRSDATSWDGLAVIGLPSLDLENGSSEVFLANLVAFGITTVDTLYLGVDGKRQYGPVQIGANSINGSVTVPATVGLTVKSFSNGAAQVADFGLDGGSALIVQNVTGPGISAVSYGEPGVPPGAISLSLTHHPIIGSPLAADPSQGPGAKPHYSGSIGIAVNDPTSLDLENAVVQGWSSAGVLVTGMETALLPDAGLARARIKNSTFSENGCVGLQVASGSATVEGSVFSYNDIGLAQSNAVVGGNGDPLEQVVGQVLFPAGDGGPDSQNQFFCNTATWRSASCLAGQGIAVGVLNNSGLPLAVAGASWDSAQPAIWVCNPDLITSECTSSGNATVNGPLPAAIAPNYDGVLGSISISHPGPAHQGVCP